MKDYYAVLGLDQSATEKEIKRAYFKLIRKYSPESDVEKFQEIREAYEFLKTHRDEFVIPLPEDQFARKMVEEIEKNIKYRLYDVAIECCEEGKKYYPEEFYFQYQLGQCQVYNGNTGNAIRTFQAMVQKYPQHKECIRGLAIAYYERGFYKKALPVFEQAYQLGCKEIDFVLKYCDILNDTTDALKIRELINPYLEQENDIGNEQIAEYLELYTRLLCNIEELGQEDNHKEIQAVLQFFDKNRVKIREEKELAGVLLISYINFLRYENNASNQELIQQLTLECDNLELDLKLRKAIEWQLNYERLEKDTRIHEDIIRYVAVHRMDMMEFPAETMRFIKLDAELCILEKVPEILKDVETLKGEYPLFYEQTKDFFNVIQNTNSLNYQKEKRLKEHRSKRMYYSQYYYEKDDKATFMDDCYSEENLEDWEETVPFVRAEKKIGRNDPCPCGSGLKYKKCCGR